MYKVELRDSNMAEHNEGSQSDNAPESYTIYAERPCPRCNAWGTLKPDGTAYGKPNTQQAPTEWPFVWPQLPRMQGAMPVLH
jgi:hypothetical protein